MPSWYQLHRNNKKDIQDKKLGDCCLGGPDTYVGLGKVFIFSGRVSGILWLQLL
jgi:hypothetical protein